MTLQERIDTIITKKQVRERECRRIIQRRWLLNNREENAARSRKWHANNSIRVRNRRLKKVYGVVPEQWEALFESQGRRCAVCPRTAPTDKSWHTDHCHDTGVIRGILCGKCNLMLGHAKDNPETLRAAAFYLEKHNGKTSGVQGGPE